MSYTTLLEIGKTILNSVGKIPETISNAAMMSEAMSEMILNTALETPSGTASGSGGVNLAPPQDDSNLSEKEKARIQKTKLKYTVVSQILAPFQKLAFMGLSKGIDASNSANADAEYQGGGDDEPWHDMAGKAATGFCSGLGGGFSNENLKRSNRLREYISQSFDKIQGALQDNLDTAVNWRTNGSFSPFAYWVANHNLSIHGQQRHVQYDEKRATQLYVDSLVSIAWRSAHCYQKCLCAPNLDRDKYRNPRERTNKYRYYPEDGENCVCQPQCWHASRRSPHEKRLFGLDKLNKYNHSMNDISRMSYNYYRANGNKYKRPNMDLRIEPIDAEAGISLPHCVSSQLQLGDFDDETTNFKFKFLQNHNRRFPCTCGNWQSNETETFMEIFNMGGGQSWMKSHAGDELFKQVCPENLKALPPLNHYLAFCRLSIRWPHNGEMLYVVPGQTDKYCGDITKYYSSWLDHEHEANKHFCKDNSVAKKIFKSQHLIPSVETSPGFRDTGVEHKCKAWLRKVEGTKHQNNIVVPQELILLSESGKSNQTRTKKGNGVFETVALDVEPLPSTVVVEESVERITVDNYEKVTAMETLTAFITQTTPETTSSVRV